MTVNADDHSASLCCSVIPALLTDAREHIPLLGPWTWLLISSVGDDLGYVVAKEAFWLGGCHGAPGERWPGCTDIDVESGYQNATVNIVSGRFGPPPCRSGRFRGTAR